MTLARKSRTAQNGVFQNWIMKEGKEEKEGGEKAMTNAEAIEILRGVSSFFGRDSFPNTVPDAIDMAISALEKQDGDWNNHKVACLLAEMFGDDCACNFNGIDEWLPMKCDFAETVCPDPAGVACWEQFLKYRSDEHGTD